LETSLSRQSVALVLTAKHTTTIENTHKKPKPKTEAPKSNLNLQVKTDTP